MKKTTTSPTIKELQEDYLRLQRAVVAYLDTETTLGDATDTYHKALKLNQKAHNLLVNLIQGKEVETCP